MIRQDKPIKRRFFSKAASADAYKTDGMLCTLDSSGVITIVASATTLPTGVISQPTSQAHGMTGALAQADVVGFGFQGVVDLKLGSTPGTLTEDALLKSNGDGTVSATTGSANQIIVGKVWVAPGNVQGGNLVQAVLCNPYKFA